MKKILLIIFIFVTILSFGESYLYDGDAWRVNEFVEKEPYRVVTYQLNLDGSKWDIKSEDWGLVGVIMSIGRDYTTNDIILAFMYKTTIPYILPNYIIVSNEDHDSHMLGGLFSLGDYWETRYDEESSTYLTSIILHLYEKDIHVLNKNVRFGILEFGNNYSIAYGMPKELFKIAADFIGVNYGERND